MERNGRDNIAEHRWEVLMATTIYGAERDIGKGRERGEDSFYVSGRSDAGFTVVREVLIKQ